MRALQTQDDEAFEAFEREEGPMLRRALASRFGPHDGGEAYAEAMAYAWEHWSRLSAMANPAGYLYRVGVSSQRRTWRWWGRTSELRQLDVATDDPTLVHLLDLLDRLTPAQRTCVLLVHGYGCPYRDVAALTGWPETTVTNHVHRGTARLRKEYDR